MNAVKADRPRLAEMIAASPAGETFLVPAQLCTPVFSNSSSNGHALRVLFGLLWLSAEVMRSGVQACFRVSIAEIRIASGFEGYGKDVPVLDVLESLAEEYCVFEDAGEPVKVFQHMEIADRENRVLEWVFTEEFTEMFVSPRTFSIVSISEIIRLKNGLDFFLYLQVRRIWKMRKKAVELRVGDLIFAADLAESTTFQRISERVRRTAARLEIMFGSNILVNAKKEPGARNYSGVRIELQNS